METDDAINRNLWILPGGLCRVSPGVVDTRRPKLLLAAFRCTIHDIASLKFYLITGSTIKIKVKAFKGWDELRLGLGSGRIGGTAYPTKIYYSI